MENLITDKSPEAYKRIRQKIAHGEDVYLKNSMNGVAIRITRYNNYNWAKSKDEREYRIMYSSDLIGETIQEANEITKEQYDNF